MNPIAIRPGMQVAVVGLGISGRAAVKYARQCGAAVRVSDSRPAQKFLAEERELLDATEALFEAGGHTVDFLRQAELLLVSPGVNLQAPVIREVQALGIPVVGELAVAAGRIGVPLVAVTGTNGKTTVTTLIGELLAKAGKKAFVGGNIGTPLYEYLCNPAGYDAVVAEVSSFQLESAGAFAPNVGVLLNITPDHLDRHGSIENYAEIKMRLFRHQRPADLAVVNGDDGLCRRLPDGVRAQLRTFGSREDNTAVICDTAIQVKINGEQENYPLAGTALGNNVGLQNAAAAILAVRQLGCGRDEVLAGLQEFRLGPHRIEFIAEVAGVAYYNDSKATNTGAVIAALDQFAGNVILIAGGRDKGDDYRLLRPGVAARVRHLLVIGEAADLLTAALADVVAISRAGSMAAAVRQAAEMARPGDVVLLSPACASFDMFTSYGHRGAEFKKAVLGLLLAELPGMVKN